ncbi:MAG: carbamate kinase [Planctomycetota bacterium]|jgi:carbamate kinase
MLVVVALGGNALLRRGEPIDAAMQRRNVEIAATAIEEISRDHTVVVTHGNGPQVGLLALQAAAFDEAQPYPLDVLGALSEGLIGYLVAQELTNRMPGRRVATLLTQVEIHPDDPALQDPKKPIGPTYDEKRAKKLAKERGWTVAKDGDFYRRVVPSPLPRRIRELPTIRLLVDAGILVVCAGGGGIPVVVTPDGTCRGIEAVIDKDLSASLLAQDLKAQALLMLTDVAEVQVDWGTEKARPISRATPEEMRRHAFAGGSMGPKVEAGCQFVEKTGGIAGIGALRNARAILDRQSGTVIEPA